MSQSEEETDEPERGRPKGQPHPEPVEEIDEETQEPGYEHDDYDEEAKAKREERHEGQSRPEEEY